MKVACIGCGNMGGAVVRGLCKFMEPSSIFITAKHFENAQKLAESTKTNAIQTNEQAASKAELIFLAVKPAFIEQVIDEILPQITQDKVIVSMAAGINLQKLSSLIQGKTKNIIRIMPNMPAQIGCGMTALCATKETDSIKIQDTKKLLESTGCVEVIDEKLMDCVTGVSGSGPAFVFMFIEAMADAAVLNGMPRAQAYTYATETVYGSAAMARSSEKIPAQLKDAVCSPGGTTIEGVAALENSGLRSSVIQAVTAAAKKSASMNK